MSFLFRNIYIFFLPEFTFSLSCHFQESQGFPLPQEGQVQADPSELLAGWTDGGGAGRSARIRPREPGPGSTCSRRILGLGTPAGPLLTLLCTRGYYGGDTETMPWKTPLRTRLLGEIWRESPKHNSQLAGPRDVYKCDPCASTRKQFSKVSHFPGKGGGHLIWANEACVGGGSFRAHERSPAVGAARAAAGKAAPPSRAGVLPEVTGGSGRWRVERRFRPHLALLYGK